MILNDSEIEQIQSSHLGIEEKMTILIKAISRENERKKRLINMGYLPICEECFTKEYPELYSAYNILLEKYNINPYLVSDTGVCTQCAKTTDVFVPKILRYFIKEIFPKIENNFKSQSNIIPFIIEEILYDKLRIVYSSQCFNVLKEKIDEYLIETQNKFNL